MVTVVDRWRVGHDVEHAGLHLDVAAVGLVSMDVSPQDYRPTLVVGQALDLRELAVEAFVVEDLLVR